jgi:hypothetical protein
VLLLYAVAKRLEYIASVVDMWFGAAAPSDLEKCSLLVCM